MHLPTPSAEPLSPPPGTDRTPVRGPLNVSTSDDRHAHGDPRRRAHNSRRGPIGRSVRTLGRPRKEPLAGCSGRAPLAPPQAPRGPLAGSQRDPWRGRRRAPPGVDRRTPGPLAGARNGTLGRPLDNSAEDRSDRAYGRLGRPRKRPFAESSAGSACTDRQAPRGAPPACQKDPSAVSPAGSIGADRQASWAPAAPPEKTFGGRPK
jgi:hypothetical protein